MVAGWSGIMARGKAIGELSSSCPCWGADQSSLSHCGSGDGGHWDGGKVLVGVIAHLDWWWGISHLLHLDM